MKIYFFIVFYNDEFPNNEQYHFANNHQSIALLNQIKMV